MKTSGALRLALFDCDGTLVDSQHTIIASMSAAFTALGRPEPAAEQVRRIVGLRLDQAIDALAGGLDGGALEGAVAAYLAAFEVLHADPEHVEPLYDGVSAVLDILETGGWLLGVATGKSHPGLISTLSRHGMCDRFVTLQTADRAAGKPAPDMVLRALAEAGVAKDRVVVVGDTAHDIGMAANAGAPSVGVGWGYHPLDALVSAGATRTATSFAALPALLEALVPA